MDAGEHVTGLLTGLLGRLRGAWADSLLRNSMYLMGATVLTSGLGFLFWTVAARGFSTREVGLAASVVAVATALSLGVHLGPAAVLIERLPAHEGTPGWGQRVWTAVIATFVGSGLLAGLALLLAGHSASLGGLSGSPIGSAMVILGCAAWSGSNVLYYAFVAARRADQTALVQTLTSVLKLALLGGFALAALRGLDALVAAWALSATLGMLVALTWQLPRIGMGVGAPRMIRPTAAAWRSTFGHHLTSTGAVLTPYLLPPLVAAVLSPTDNAYFYLTWMLGSLFFMVSPSVAASLFAEGVHDPAGLPAAVARTARLITVLLSGPVLIAVLAGHWLLGIFGPEYASHGYLLLVLLVISTAPDAVTNVAVGIFRATGELWRSTALNLGMAAITLLGAAVLAPRMGIDGVGLAWLLAQVLGAAWVLPRLRIVLREIRAGAPAERGQAADTRPVAPADSAAASA